ncbi:MAG: AAA family ATPase [Pirellulales bacterium]|nr:AAA family ATPase [Pirellulales bacterium]
MSVKDETTSLERGANGQSLVVQRNAPLGGLDAEWSMLPPAPAMAQRDPSAYLHAIRRHWLLGCVLGVIAAVALATTTWFALPRHYTATALINVAMYTNSFTGRDQRYLPPQEYENFKATQVQQIRSTGVLNAALRDDPKITMLSIYQREKADPITWLQDELVVGYAGDGGLMMVSLTDNDPKEVTTVVQAVVDAYDRVVIEAEAKAKRDQLTQLGQILVEREAKERAVRSRVQNLSEQTKATDSRSISVAQQVAVQRLGDYRREHVRVQFELRNARADLSVADAALKRIDDDETGSFAEFEIEQLLLRDPIYNEYNKMISGLGMAVAQTEAAAQKGIDRPFLKRLKEQQEAAQAALDERVEVLREMMKKGKRSELDEEAAGLRVKVAILEGDEKVLREEVAAQEREVEELTRSSVDFEMALAELDNISATRAKIAEEREALEVETRAPARIEVKQPAFEPMSHDNPGLIIAVTVLAGVAGLVLPLAGIVLWDVRKQRINSSEDVAHRLGLPVIGSVPVIPSRTIRRLGSPTKTSRQWNVRLTESIDAIAAKLLRNAAIDEDRVVLITSAVSGEGKTTLATQIAMSLARAGRQTVLVDFDLRRPAIDKAFQLPLQPGVSEALCGESEIHDLAQATGTKNLSVITAGRCDRHALQALANGMDQRILDTLRAEFEFVIVDGSPILPVADSRYVAQHVDSVVLSVFRDYSRAPKVMAACEILETFGVRDVEAVVTSSSEDGYGVMDNVPQE